MAGLSPLFPEGAGRGLAVSGTQLLTRSLPRREGFLADRGLRSPRDACDVLYAEHWPSWALAGARHPYLVTGLPGALGITEHI